jgi:hypothetical protein
MSLAQEKGGRGEVGASLLLSVGHANCWEQALLLGESATEAYDLMVKSRLTRKPDMFGTGIQDVR